MADLDYNNLYRTQDLVLKLVFDTTQEFYLTGGTCLHRFYYEKRYSDDLDFFTNNSDLFRQSVNAVFDAIANLDLDFKKSVDSKDFVRFVIIDHNQLLQIDFVNDRVNRIGVARQKDGYLIDTIDNILSNKLTAVLGRDEPKDVFDIYTIAVFEDIDWAKIIGYAMSKVLFQKEDLLYRLDTFPKNILKKLKLIDDSFLDDFDAIYADIISRIKGCTL